MSEQSSQKYIDEYVPRKWVVYDLNEELGAEPMTEGFTEAGIGLVACELEGFSPDRVLYGEDLPFFMDLERVFAGIEDRVGGFMPGVLTEEWLGHPAGSIAMVSFTGSAGLREHDVLMVEVVASGAEGQ